MTGVYLLAGFTVGVLALGHCLLGMIFGLPFKGRDRIAYFALVGGAVLLWIAAYLSHIGVIA